MIRGRPLCNSTMYRYLVSSLLLFGVVGAQFAVPSKELPEAYRKRPEKPLKTVNRFAQAPNLSAQPVNAITMDGQTFVQNFLRSTYYIREGGRNDGGAEADRPRTLIPDARRYRGPALFYAFYNPRFGRTFYVNYRTGERGSVDGFHVFDDALEKFQPVTMVEKMMEMMRDTPFFN